MPDHPSYTSLCSIARTTGCHAEPGGSDNRRRPTYTLTLHSNGRFTHMVGCRFDDPAGTLARIGRARRT
jgi:hypothetical protein